MKKIIHYLWELFLLFVLNSMKDLIPKLFRKNFLLNSYNLSTLKGLRLESSNLTSISIPSSIKSSSICSSSKSKPQNQRITSTDSHPMIILILYASSLNLELKLKPELYGNLESNPSKLESVAKPSSLPFLKI